jgi:flagellar protein FlaJ
MEVILRDMDYFGNDLRTALHNICEITPSEKFRDLMYNLLTVIDSGGDISYYLRDKSEQYLIKAKVEQKGFLETLGLMAESYVTAFVAGPLFIIILGVMMAVMTPGGNNVMLYAIIYAVIPIGSMMFVVMISIITPGSTGEAPLLPVEHNVGEITVPETEEKPVFLNFIKSRDSINLRKTIMSPLKPLKEKPEYTLAITVPIVLIYLIISMFQGMKAPDFIDFIDNKIVFAIYIIVIL